MSVMRNEEYPRPFKIFERLRQRRLYKEVAAIRLDDIDVRNSITRDRFLRLNLSDLAKLEQRVAEIMNCEPWEVIAHRKSIRHPAYQASGGLEPEAIHVLSDDGTSRTMSEFPDLISARVPKTERLHVIAPLEIDGLDNRQKKREAADSLKCEIRNVIFDSVGGVL